MILTPNQTLVSLTAEDFAAAVRARKQAILQRYERLNSETSRHWSEISTRMYDFGRRERIASFVSELTLADIVAFYDRYLAIDAPERCKIAIWAHGPKQQQCLAASRLSSAEVAGEDQDGLQGGTPPTNTTGIVNMNAAKDSDNNAEEASAGSPGSEECGDIGDIGDIGDNGERANKVHIKESKESVHIDGCASATEASGDDASEAKQMKKDKRALVVIEDHVDFRSSMPLFPAAVPVKVEAPPVEA